jgi:GNAT superfamily N-acetyltransferase
MMEERIQLTVNPDNDAVMRLASRLRAYNRSQAPQGEPWSILLSVNDDAGELVAGLYATISYSWMLVDLLWVAEAARKQRYGTKLLQKAELHAYEHGCYAMWLDTYSFQARGFYEKHGFALFGELPNYPPGHSRFFLWKKLS